MHLSAAVRPSEAELFKTPVDFGFGRQQFEPQRLSPRR
jgi:hypothetical protein